MSEPKELTKSPGRFPAARVLSKSGALLRVLLATLAALTATQLLDAVLAGDPLIPRSDVAGVSEGQHVLLWLLSSFLIVGALSYCASLSSLHGIGLVTAIAVALFGLRYLLPLVECAVFLPSMTLRDASDMVFTGARDSVAFAICVAVAVGKSTGATVEKPEAAGACGTGWSAVGWAWRWSLCALAYLCLYVTAGMTVFPFVKEYYPDLNVDFAFLCGLQIRRGLLYVACLVPLVRSIHLSRGQVALATALLVPIMNGAADLLVPNAYMPATAWRMAHLVEVSVSDFLFGSLIGYTFSCTKQVDQGRRTW